MDIGKAFTFVTEDERWLTKIGVGALIMLFSFLIVPIPLLIGYQVAVTRNVMKGVERPLPEWDNLGQFFLDGLYVIIALFVYSLPLLLLFCIGFGVTFLPVLGGGSEDATAALGGIAALSWIVVTCLFILLALVLAFVSPAVFIQYARTGELGTLFRFGEVLGIARAHLADILIVFLVNFAAQAVLSIAITILAITICGPFIAGLAGPVWISVATGHLYGQIASKAS